MADDSEQVGQDEIEQLLRQSQSGAKPAEPTDQEPASEETSGTVDQSEIEALLGGGSPAAPTAPTSGAMPAAQSAGDASVSQNDIELLLTKAEQALESIDQPADSIASA